MTAKNVPKRVAILFVDKMKIVGRNWPTLAHAVVSHGNTEKTKRGRNMSFSLPICWNRSFRNPILRRRIKWCRERGLRGLSIGFVVPARTRVRFPRTFFVSFELELIMGKFESERFFCESHPPSNFRRWVMQYSSELLPVKIVCLGLFFLVYPACGEWGGARFSHMFSYFYPFFNSIASYVLIGACHTSLDMESQFITPEWPLNFRGGRCAMTINLQICNTHH